MQFKGEHSALEDQRRRWRLHYCGTCKTMGQQYGGPARLLLNHDAVFLSELLTALGAVEVEQWNDAYRSWNCFRLPDESELPVVLRYTAAVNVLLSEYKIADHAADSGKRHWTMLRRLFSRTFRNAQAELARLGFPLEQCKAILSRQAAIEAQTADIDKAASPTAEVTALVFSNGARIAGLPGQSAALADVGRRFGRLIYLLDAWEDFDGDARSGDFNPLIKSGVARDWGAERIRIQTNDLIGSLSEIGCPTEFQLRLRANVAARLTSQFQIVHSCRERAPRSLAHRWHGALAKTREFDTSPLAFAAVFGFAFLFPFHARMAKSSSECLSLGLNLMAIGGLMATVQEVVTKKETGASKGCCNAGDCLSSCGEGCCESCSGCDCS